MAQTMNLSWQESNGKVGGGYIVVWDGSEIASLAVDSHITLLRDDLHAFIDLEWSRHQ